MIKVRKLCLYLLHLGKYINKEEIKLRRNSFKALVGSHNYNLQTPESDRDYKIFFYPAFDDLYSGEKYSKAKTSDNEDIEYHDIRKLPDMLWKSNVNFLEVLFSQEVQSDDTLYEKLHNRREEIARMNLPYLYDACMGMFYKKKKEYERDLNYIDLEEDDAVRMKKVNKHAMSAYRIMDFLYRYCANNFTDFQNAIKYKKKDQQRDFLLSIRNGHFEDVGLLVEQKLIQANSLKESYKGKELNEELKEWIYDAIKEQVRDNILEELQ
jgi:hypothetical protein